MNIHQYICVLNTYRDAVMLIRVTKIKITVSEQLFF